METQKRSVVDVKLMAVLIAAIVVCSGTFGAFLMAAPTNVNRFYGGGLSLATGGDGFSIGGDTQLYRSAAGIWSMGAGNTMSGIFAPVSDINMSGNHIYGVGDMNATDVHTSSLYVNGEQFNETEIIIYPQLPYKYIIWSDGTNYFQKNSATGVIVNNTDAWIIIQGALNATITGTSRGAVYLAPGHYHLTNTLLLWGGTGLVSDEPAWSTHSASKFVGATLYADMNKALVRAVGGNDGYTWFSYVSNIGFAGSGNAAYTLNYGLQVEPLAGYTLHDMYIDHVMVKDCGSDGIYINFGGKIWIDGGYTEDNKGNGVNFRATTGGYIKGMYIYGNIQNGINNWDSNGASVIITENHIKISNGYSGITTSNSGTKMMISSNFFKGLSGTTTGIKVQMGNNEKFVTIMGNHFEDLTYGISISKGAGWVDDYPSIPIIGNIFMSTVTNKIYCTDFNLASTYNPIHYNQGLVTEKIGSSANATATSFTITHGLAGAADWVSCGFNTTAITGWSWTSDATTITVTVAGTGLPANMGCYWKAEYYP